jgi:Calx-beta domain-containing protein/uncharacterized protein DUF4214
VAKSFDLLARGNWRGRQILISGCFLIVCLLMVIPRLASSSQANSGEDKELEIARQTVSSRDNVKSAVHVRSLYSDGSIAGNVSWNHVTRLLNAAAEHFTPLPATVTISGKITNVNNRGISGITVKLSDGATQTTQTDANGNYSFNVATGLDYTVTPNDTRVSTWLSSSSDSSSTISGDSISHTNLQTGVVDNFKAQFPSFTVSGTIKFFSTGQPVTNLTNAVTLSGGASKTYPTNSQGAYTSDQLNTLGDYTFTPHSFSSGGVTYNVFSPGNASFVTMAPCSLSTSPPPGTSFCSGFDYLGVDFVAIQAPNVVTSAASAVTTTSATLNGTVNPNGIATSGSFEWGTDPTLTTSTATTSQAIGSGSANQTITTNLNGLTGGTTYYFRAVGSSNGGTVRGSILNFTAPATTRTLTVGSTNPAAGVNILITPTDNNSAGNGTTQFTRTYNNNTSVTLTAPSAASGNTFQKWLKDGADFANNTAISVSVSMDADHTMTATFTTPRTIQLQPANYLVNEGDGDATITVTRSGDTNVAATVDYTTSDSAGANPCNLLNSGIASSRCDYEATKGTLKFAAGETSKTVSIPIVDDAYAEGNENFTVILSNATGAVLGPATSALVTINDNETQNGVNPIDQAGYFVRMHYVDFLNREPDASGLSFWTGQMTNCGAADLTVCKINVSGAFFLSIEFQQTGYLVERIYKTAFGDATGTSTLGGTHPLRVPFVRLDQFLPNTQRIGQGVVVGQGNWQQQLNDNKDAFTQEFVQRPDFLAAFPLSMPALQFVGTLNNNARDNNDVKPLSQTDHDNLVIALTNGTMTRAQVLRFVAEYPALTSSEQNRAFVLMQYFGYLRRNPNDTPDSDYTGYDFWLTKLNQFNGDYIGAEMVKAFIASSEYRARFGP